MLLGIFGCMERQTEINESNTNTQTPPVTAEPPESGTSPGPPRPQDGYVPDGAMISTDELATMLREKYADIETINYQESLWDVPKGQEFFVDFAFDLVEDTEYDSYPQIFAVYSDAELTELVPTAWERVTHEEDPEIPEGHNRVYARPGRTAAGRVWGSYYDLVTREEIKLDEAGEYYLHAQGEYESWGFLKHYYIVQRIDPVTAEALEKPLVTIFTLENQLDAPQSEFYVTQDGRAAFRWTHVPEAEYYLIVEIDEFSGVWPIDKVAGTSWEYPYSNDSGLMNQRFGGILLTDDEMTGMPDDFESREARYQNYSVIAVNSIAHSPLGSIHKGDELAARLPYKLAWHANRQDADESDGNTKYIPAIGLLPTHRAISMADGATAYRRMIYDFNYAEIREDRWFAYDGLDDDGDFINPRFEVHENLYINYRIEGTVFRDTMVVMDVDAATAMTELEAFRIMLDDSSPRGGGSIESDIESPPRKQNSKTSDDAPDEILDRTDDRIFANSALSEYLAFNLIAANEMIDLFGFPESADWEHLIDAFFEAMYQNPLVMHIDGAGSIPGTNLLIVEYREPVRKIHEQQAAIRSIVPGIVAEIITPAMTDLEKSFAINNYLIENSEYDWAALEEAERNSFQTVDEKFNDSFTAYGILINRVGVCAGYADAFKLLADEAGLEAIVVTGYMEGILPHAWNRVNIDGHWHTVDVTNNANEFLLNAFMNLPDSAAGRMLIEDNQFMMNAFISGYRSSDNNSEYYHATGRLYEKGDVAAELVRLINQNGTAMLRTDYDLDDETFYEIAMEVLEALNTKELYGFYMLGVIWMSITA